MSTSTVIGTYLPSHHELGGVAASVAIAVLASYVALDLVRRVRASRGGARLAWWAGSSAAMGTGVWAMHFLGMMAFTLPVALGFTTGLTLLSWMAAVGACGIAVAVACRHVFSLTHLLLGALAMAAGICGMHYVGMAALDMEPGIVWNRAVVALSVIVAVVASGAALLIFHWLPRRAATRRFPAQLGAALLLGGAICGMHYVAMAAASFPLDSFCFSSDALGGTRLIGIVVVASAVLLLGTLLIAISDARQQARSEGFARSLQEANAQLQSANAELQQHAFSDPLTRLPNRRELECRLGQALLRLDGDGQPLSGGRLAVLFVDLDNFKPVNDFLGHAVGDEILCLAAERLRDLVCKSHTVARIGGDEFLLLLEDVADTAACQAVADRVLGLLAEPFAVAGKQMQLGCSIGMVVYPDQGQRDRLVANADVAMYVGKRAGGGACVLFEAGMGVDSADQFEMLSDLRRARERGELELHYQPKIDSHTGAMSGVEALLRWRHPVRGMVSPDVFIPIAERFGLIGRIGGWVIDEACGQMAAWRDGGVAVRVAVNVSVHQLREKDLAERVALALRRNGLGATQLLCEITESSAMEDVESTQRTFEGLAQIGVYLSIDDFGTGHSSLSYLRQLPAKQLKIDRSFVSDLESSGDARAVVQAVIQLAHALGLRVVAEGVETVGQSALLVGMDCDEQQGYLFARPLAAPALLEWALWNALASQGNAEIQAVAGRPLPQALVA